MLRHIVRIVILGTLAALIGCGGGGNVDSDAPQTDMLAAVQNDAELLDSLIKGFTQARGTAQPEAGATPAEDAAAQVSAGVSTTYTQERNVDEFDVVKYDGEFMYIAPMRGFIGCCFLAPVAADDAIVAPGPIGPRSIRVLRTDPVAGDATPVSEIEVAPTESVQGLYLGNGRMTAITTESYYGGFGEMWADVAVWAGQSVGIRIYDVADPLNPDLTWSARIEGGFVQSRRVNDTLYVVNRFTPYLGGISYLDTANARAANDAVLESTSIDDLLPKITIDGQTSSLVAPDRCYITNKEASNPDGILPGHPVLTTITSISLSNPSVRETICYNESAYGAYVSEQAVYLTQSIWSSTRGSAFTRVHKFSLAGLNYRGSAEVKGTLWTGGQNDFRMSEHQGLLRMVMTEYQPNDSDRVDYALHVLQEAAGRRALQEIATLPNDARPGEIGKPNEWLYGVRFFGDRAYLVTFERIDPLIVLDLTSPRDPFIAGELEVTGFSDFLHPVSSDLLLGLGRADTGGVKLELFDVSDIGMPSSLGSQVVGTWGTHSEAQYDRHAFTYLAGASTDRFTVPADVYENYNWIESGLYFFEITGKATPTIASLLPAGSLVVEERSLTQSWPMGWRNRAVINGDAVFYVRDEAVWSRLLGRSRRRAWAVLRPDNEASATVLWHLPPFSSGRFKHLPTKRREVPSANRSCAQKMRGRHRRPDRRS